IPESDPEEDPEEEDEEDPEEDPAYYPADIGDDDEEYNTLCFQVIEDVNKFTMYLLYCTHLL
ncbi:hypothetical protein Tco_0685289, partial [Tanacetum coccineum]